MNIQEKLIHGLNSAFTAETAVSPKQLYASAISRLAEQFPDLEVPGFDRTGHIRHLSGQSGMFAQPFLGDASQHATKFLGTSTIAQAFSLSNVTLAEGVSEEMPFGHRVAYAQQIVLKDGTKLNVRGAHVHVSMDKSGKIFNVTSTLKFGRRPVALGKIITADEAIALAKAKFAELTKTLSKNDKSYARNLLGAIDTSTATAKLVLSEHRGRFDAVYEVQLSTGEPRQLMLFLVKAKTKEVVFHQSLLHYSVSSTAQQAALGRVPAKCFLRIPDPKVGIPQQVHDHFVEELPDAKLLQNERFIMKVREGKKWVTLAAKADGTYNFDAVKEVDAFTAVATFIAINTQMVLFETLGMKKQSRPIPVFINDPGVTDNAYFDPENYEIHIGKGSGLPNGLNKIIGFDLGVSWHENGHHVVMLQTPGQDLPGPEGGALHESTGDICQLIMQYWFALTYGAAIGQTFTAADIKADKRIIGLYALPPNGIRIQRNTKTVRDKTGEVHDDGEISGAATADILEAYTTTAEATSDVIKLKAQLELYVKTYLLALALVPPSKVTFRDMRRAFITADGQLSGGVNKAAIEKGFNDHGITAGTQPATKTGKTGTTGKSGKGRRRK
jgi:Zn-dependent metalloprotease